MVAGLRREDQPGKLPDVFAYYYSYDPKELTLKSS